MKTLAIAAWVLAAATLAPQAQAQPLSSEAGPYAVAALGRAQYDHDCYFFSSCDTSLSTAGKLGAGWRFGVFAVEAWWLDLGRATIAPQQDHLSLRGFGVGGAWYLRFNSSLQGVLRTGGVELTQHRSREASSRHLEPYFGLGLVLQVAPVAAVELAWDVSTSQGDNAGSVLGNALTVGLRLRF
jgi:hypothetical protein